MSIWGTGSPRIISSDGLTTVDLDYTEILKNEPDPTIIRNENKLTGEKQLIVTGKHHIVELKYHLYKETVPATSYTNLMALFNTYVILYLHRDQLPFMSTDGGYALFYFEETREFYLENSTFKDAMILKFRSTESLDYGESLGDSAYLITDLDEPLITDDGDNLIHFAG